MNQLTAKKVKAMFDATDLAADLEAERKRDPALAAVVDIWNGHESVLAHYHGVYLLDRRKIHKGGVALHGSHRYYAVYVAVPGPHYGEWLAFERLRRARRHFDTTARYFAPSLAG